MQTDQIDKMRSEFLMEVYKIRVQFHSEHLNRLWTRFNYLLVTEIALLGFFFTDWVNSNSWERVRMLPILGIFVSILWYILGAQDHYYFEGFRKQVQSLEKTLANEFGASALDELLFGQVKGIKRNLVTWHWNTISLSKLIAIFPLLFLALWAAILFLTSS